MDKEHDAFKVGSAAARSAAPLASDSEPGADLGGIRKSFGASARAWRSRLGISQEEVAVRAGLHRTYVSDIERGARNPSLESISRLARALGISMSTFFLEAGQAGIGAGQSAVSSEAPGDILFVENNPTDVKLTLEALKMARFTNRIEVVNDGAAALDFIFMRGDHGKRQGQSLPEMVLLDLSLPKISGLEVLKEIKAEPTTRHIPVVVLAASREDQDIMASRKLGAEAYIVKPVDFHNLSAITPQLHLRWALLRSASPAAL
jgi:CheY-like chemotaxis protein/ribosome-binding protein aMBF1 (putative translation factor)